MKTIKSLKFVLLFIAIFSLSACELVQEPNFDQTTESGDVRYPEYDRE